MVPYIYSLRTRLLTSPRCRHSRLLAVNILSSGGMVNQFKNFAVEIQGCIGVTRYVTTDRCRCHINFQHTLFTVLLATCSGYVAERVDYPAAKIKLIHCVSQNREVESASLESGNDARISLHVSGL
jgi:hypothetical protein